MTLVWSMGIAAFVPVASAATLVAGDLIKGSGPAVYFYAADGKRYTFPTESIYKSWFSNFSGIKTITDTELANISLASQNIVMRPGTNLIKISSIPKVFAVELNGKLAWIKDEATAIKLYGADWAKKIAIVPDGFWGNYSDTGKTLDGTAYPTGQLVKFSGSNDIYYVNADGTKSLVSTDATFAANGWKTADVISAPATITMSTGTAISSTLYNDVSQGGGTGTGSTLVTGGTVSVSLASDNPAAAYIIADASTNSSEYLKSVFKATLTASASTEVDSIAFTRSGISANADFANLYLYDGDTLISDAYSLSGNVFTFNKNFIVTGSKTVTLKVDLATGTSASKNFAFSLADVNAVKLVSGTVSGAFPISSNTFVTSSVTDLGQLKVASVNGTPGSSVEAGQVAQTLFKFTLEGNDQKLNVTKLAFTAIGTIETSSLANLYLYDGTKKLGDTVAALDASKKVVFNLSTPYVIDRETKTLYLKGDIVSGTGRNFYFEVENPYDITVYDTGYNVYVKPYETSDTTPDTWTIVKNTTTSTIGTGSITISKDTVKAPSGNIARGATNKTIGVWKLKATGEDIKVTSLTVNMTVTAGWGTADLDNSRLYYDGSQVGTTKDLDTNGATATGTEFSLGSSVIVPAGVEKELKLVADIRKGDGTALTNAWTLQADLAAGSSNYMRMSTGTSDSTGASTGNQLTIATPTLTTTKNSSFSNQTALIMGSQKVKIGSWLITAGAAEDVNLTSVTINDDGAKGIGSAFQNIALYYGATQVGSTVASPSSTNGASNSFDFSNPVKIAAGQSVQVDLYGDVKTGTAADLWTNADEIAITAASGTSLDTNTTVSDSTGAVGQALTLASAGTLTIATASTPIDPISTYLVAGKLNQTVGTWKYSASNSEDIKVYRIVVTEYGTDDLPGNVQNLKLYVDGAQVGSTVPSLINDTANTATFESSTALFTVTKNSYKYVYLKTDLTGAEDGSFSTDGSDLRFSVDNVVTQTASTAVSAKGAMSSVYVTGAAGATYGSNGVHKYVKSKPTFTKVNPSTTSLTPGTMEVLRFKIAADAGADVIFNGSNHNIRLTVTSTSTGTAANKTFTLWDADNTSTALQTIATADVDTGSTIDFDAFTLTVPAGSEKTVYIKGDLSIFSTAGNSFEVDVNNAAADFSWSDSVTSADITNANFAGIGLPLYGSNFVKP